MKAAATREGEDLFDDLSSRGFDVLLGGSQVTRVDHHQQGLYRARQIARKSPGEPAIDETGVVWPVVFELPSERGTVELFCGGDVDGRKFDVIDLDRKSTRLNSSHVE